ncbi:MAG: hypothetical protein NMNS02_26530 [Nitrosomonas sp.]|nr:MAG: hypothetical protein NMNS02_26530 [Nitrosomonas sp.]
MKKYDKQVYEYMIISVYAKTIIRYSLGIETRKPFRSIIFLMLFPVFIYERSNKLTISDYRMAGMAGIARLENS